ncbi:MAG: PEP-CTERM sorting domain-containing protein [Verrucomicrobia bacterium]|nr:PEP-CTERM sorting domain-containing protein [Verrucomicrobiota bacterium]
MKTITVAFCFLLAMSVASLATLVYDIDYEPPTYTNGQQVGGGSTETISDSINGFSSQGLLVHDGGSINYFAPGGLTDPFTSGLHLVSWEFAIPESHGSSQVINGQLHSLGVGGVLFDTTLSISGSTGNEILYGSGFPNRPGIPFNIGQAYSFEVLMDLDANHYSFWVDGNLLEDSVSIPSDADLFLVDFGQNQIIGLQAGIDNFQWQIIPEPSSLILLLCGGTLLMTWRRRRQRV